MKKFLMALVIVSLFAVPAFADERCDNCRMKVKADSMYRVTVLMKDGRRKPMCSIYCASMEKERSGEDAAGLVVVDYNTGEELKAGDAVWAEGGDIPAVMSDKPRVAFKDAASAGAFVKAHGGRVASFKEVYENSVTEWKGR